MAARARRSPRPASVAFWALAITVAALLLSWVYAALWPRREAAATGADGRLIRVQVLNGSREGGIGARVAAHLRAGGFQVVEVGNADRSDYGPTLVVGRRADPSAARIVARYLGDPPVLQQIWSSDAADVTVVLGSDRTRLRIDGPGL